MQDLQFEVVAEKEQDNYGKFIISPLAYGYGATLGNALRRVLLSSLKGAAATKVKIKGVRHRFSTLKGLKEDVLELLLNIKEVRFKLTNVEKASVKLEKAGPGEVTAADLKLPAGVDIVNKDLSLGTLANKKAKLNLEVEVESGYGYSPFEERGLEKIGILPIDAVFSPIKRVNYKVEETRVGRVTNLDKLILEVWTDGTIAPKEAFEESVEILIAYFSRLLGKEAPKAVEDTNGGEESIHALGLNARIENALSKEGIKTLDDLAQLSKSDLKKIRNMGQKSVQLIKEALTKKGIKLQ